MTHGETALKTSPKQRTVYHAFLLGVIATVSGGLVVFGNLETHNIIDQRHAEDMKASLSQVVHPDTYNNNILKDTLTLKYHGTGKKLFIARENGKFVATAFEMTTIGYSGPIKIIMGINGKGVLLGVRVLSHTETPGLGDKIEAKKSKWIFSFDQMSYAKLKPQMWKVKKDKGFFDQFTGATITPRAVVKAIKEGMDLFTNHKEEIVGSLPSSAPASITTPPTHKTSEEKSPENNHA